MSESTDEMLKRFERENEERAKKYPDMKPISAIDDILRVFIFISAISAVISILRIAMGAYK